MSAVESLGGLWCSASWFLVMDYESYALLASGGGGHEPQWHIKFDWMCTQNNPIDSVHLSFVPLSTLFCIKCLKVTATGHKIRTLNSVTALYFVNSGCSSADATWMFLLFH